MFGGWLFFSAFDSSGQYAVWRTDGSQENTLLVVPASSYPTNMPFTFKTFQNKLFFASNHRIWYLETPDGQPQPLVESTTSFSPPWMKELDDHLIFIWHDSEHGDKLWTSDGTPAGTHILENDLAWPSYSSLFFGLVHQNILYFRATNNTLWSYRPAQHQLTQLFAQKSTGLVAMGNWVYFFAYDETNGGMLYRTDGLDVQPAVKLSTSNVQVGFFGALTRENQNYLLFHIKDADNQTWLYSSNGAQDGLTKLAGPLSITSNSIGYANGRYFFGARDATHSAEVWQSDGTTAGTSQVKDIYPGLGGSYPDGFGSCGTRICFFASDDIHGLEPWSTDGTPEGTQMLVDANPTASDSNFIHIQPAGERLYFIAHDGVHRNLYRVTPAAAGVELLNQSVDPNDNNGVMASVGDQVFFLEDLGDNGFNLWRVAGPTSSPELIKNLGKLDGSTAIEHLQAFNQAVFFPFGDQLWTSNGSASDTQLLYDMADPIKFLTAFDNRLVFGTYNSSGSTKLYVSNGTGPTPTLGTISGQIANSAQTGPNLFIDLVTSDNAHQLWQVNATTLALQQVAAPTCLGSFGTISRLTAVGDTLYFLNRSTSQTQMTLLKVHSAREGAECIWSASLDPNSAAWDGTPMAVFQDKVFFEIPGADGGFRLMSSDGTSAGTLPLPGQDSLFQGAAYPLPAAGGLFFQATTQAEGRELWFWDGEQAPNLISILNPGPASSSPRVLLAYNESLYFATNDSIGRRELWTFDTSQIPPANAGFTPDLSAGIAPLSVTFSPSNYGSENTFTWDFGDGSSSSEPNPTHTFTSGGEYPVSLEISGYGVKRQVTKTITVYEPAQAKFDPPAASGIPYELCFANHSTGSYTTLQWDFGDGTTSAEANPSHRYQQPGTYQVTLTVTGPGGTSQSALQITIPVFSQTIYLPSIGKSE